MKLTKTIKSWFTTDERPAIGRRGAGAPSAAFDVMDFSFLALRDILSSSTGVIATKLHIITLRRFREAIGASAWNRFVRTVHSIAEGVIRRHLGRANLCGRAADDTFVLSFNALPEIEARRMVRIIAADLMQKLIGDRFQGAQIMVTEIDAATIIMEGQRVDEAALDAAIDSARAVEHVEEYELAAAGVHVDPCWQDMIVAHGAGDPVWMDLAIHLYRRNPHWRAAAARLAARDPHWRAIAPRLDNVDPGWYWRLKSLSADDPSWLETSVSAADGKKIAYGRRWRDLTANDGGGLPQSPLIKDGQAACPDAGPVWCPLQWPPKGWQAGPEAADVNADIVSLPEGAAIAYRPTWRRHSPVIDTYLCVARSDADVAGGGLPEMSSAQRTALNLALVQATMRQLNEDIEARRCSTLILPIRLSLLTGAHWTTVRTLLREASDAARQRYLLVEVIDIPERKAATNLAPVVNAVKTLCRDVLLQTPSAATGPGRFKACLPFATGIDIAARQAGEAAVADRIKRLATRSGRTPLYVWGVDRSIDFAAAVAAGCVYVSGQAVGMESTAPVPKASLQAGLPATV